MGLGLWRRVLRRRPGLGSAAKCRHEIVRLVGVLTFAAVNAVIFIGLFLYIAIWWQKRGVVKPKELPTSTYGRPLVKKA